MKRYVKLTNGSIIDTKKLIPHMEEYFIDECYLYYKTAEDVVYCLGKVDKNEDNYESL